MAAIVARSKVADSRKPSRARASALRWMSVISVGTRVVDVKVVQRTDRAISGISTGVVIVVSGRFELRGKFLVVFVVHLLGHTVGPEGGDAAAHVNPGLVDRVAECFAGVAADHEYPSLSHERAHVSDVAAYDDIDTFHRDAAPRSGITLDD